MLKFKIQDKFQAPSTKLQINPKFQLPNDRNLLCLENWNLKIGAYFGFGICDLEFNQ